MNSFFTKQRFFQLVFVLTMIALLFFGGWSYGRTKKLSEELRGKDEKIQSLEAELQKEIALREDKEKSQYSMSGYADYLEEELAITHTLIPDAELFTSYRYGFVFAEKNAELPLNCSVDKRQEIYMESPGGAGPLTLRCALGNDRVGQSWSTPLTKLVTDHNLVTPFFFVLEGPQFEISEETTPTGKTPRGKEFYRTLMENVEGLSGGNTTYDYAFYSHPLPVSEHTNEKMFYKFHIQLTVFDATDEKLLDSLAGRIIDRVSYKNFML